LAGAFAFTAGLAGAFATGLAVAFGDLAAGLAAGLAGFFLIFGIY
jgi:hypothetical protein